MALQPTDFIRPAGRLREEHFPGDDLDALLTTWIQNAQAKTSGLGLESEIEEKAQAAWVYHLAYSDIADRLNFNPATVDVDGEVSTQTLVSQMKDARTKADAYADAFDALTTDETAASGTRSTTTPSATSWV